MYDDILPTIYTPRPLTDVILLVLNALTCLALSEYDFIIPMKTHGLFILLSSSPQLTFPSETPPVISPVTVKTVDVEASVEPIEEAVIVPIELPVILEIFLSPLIEPIIGVPDG